MKVWLVCEHPDGWGGVPNDLDGFVCGVFVTREAAEECIRTYMRHYHSFEGSRLFLKDGTAQDAHGNLCYQIIERHLGVAALYPHWDGGNGGDPPHD